MRIINLYYLLINLLMNFYSLWEFWGGCSEYIQTNLGRIDVWLQTLNLSIHEHGISIYLGLLLFISAMFFKFQHMGLTYTSLTSFLNS